ncbi:hypothetical protein IX57_16115 [Paracoccus sanguinis]|uniref:DUF2062 domain-containing protein n=2 Tax=Paracoccus sanguinis TaxID=1545044 RepID=A0A1H2QJ51_9RHOB|nr:hypothetical protein IX57_16115 [Paracoccus sanguinis]SDW07166.1 hypothetical protein SAMN05444276_10148 [Paracoccus sanguinis]
MFRRKPRSYSQMASDIVYPRGGWWRAIKYRVHRLRRLPDPPQRVARGVAAGVFISFTPLFGLHVVGAMALALAIRGNVLASVIGSFVGNPLTIPVIAVVAITLGRWMLGQGGSIDPMLILEAFSGATRQFLRNLLAVLDGRPAEWDRLVDFAQAVFLPYMVGGLIPGLIAALLFHRLTVPLVEVYHQRRLARRARKARAEGAVGDDPGRPDAAP